MIKITQMTKRLLNDILIMFPIILNITQKTSKSTPQNKINKTKTAWLINLYETTTIYA